MLKFNLFCPLKLKKFDKMKIKSFVIIVSFLFLIGQISAVVPTLNYENRLDFGHVLVIRNISTVPETLIPGEPSILKMIVENTGNQFVNDIVITFNSTDEIYLINDISKRKIPRLYPNEFKEIYFDIIALPNAAEGVYKPKIIADYVNHVGEERQDAGEIGLAVKALPGIFAKIDSTEIYKGNNLGAVTIKFVNNGMGDAKFLTVEILESKDYEVISSNTEYIGDLDSDDFESVNFRIKINNEKNTNLLLKINYKDSLNKDYSKDFKLPFKIRDAKELGIKTNGTSTIIIVILIIIIASYFIYKRYKKKKKIIKKLSI
jgi:hypothetical protein